MSTSVLGGHIGVYSSYNDRDANNDPVVYDFKYNSGWLDLGEDFASYIKILKSINGTVYTATASNAMSILWDFDFKNLFDSYVVNFVSSTDGAEWGIGEWGIAEWGGGGSLLRFTVPTSGSGQYIKIGVSVPISENTFALQQMNLYSKIGRLAN